MKGIRLIISCLLLFLVSSSAFGDSITVNDLVGVGFNPGQADVLSSFDTTLDDVFSISMVPFFLIV